MFYFVEKRPELLLLCRAHLKLIKKKNLDAACKAKRAAGFLHVKLMFLIMCEELIRNGRRRSTLPGRTPGLT